MINHDLFCLKGLILPWSGLGHPAGRLKNFRASQRPDSRLCCSSSSPSSRAWQIRSNPDIVLAKPRIQFGLHRPFDWAAWRNSFAGSFICVHGLDTHTKQSRPVKDNIEEVTHISSFATYVTSVHWRSSGTGVVGAPSCSGDIATPVALQALPKFLPAYVMLCTLLGIPDFPHQECQPNRKRDKLRELCIYSKQVTMNNKGLEGQKGRPGRGQPAVLWRIHQICHGRFTAVYIYVSIS